MLYRQVVGSVAVDVREEEDKAGDGSEMSEDGSRPSLRLKGS